VRDQTDAPDDPTTSATLEISKNNRLQIVEQQLIGIRIPFDPGGNAPLGFPGRQVALRSAGGMRS